MAAPWTVGSIVARLQLDTSAFSRGITAATNAINAFGTKVASVIRSLASPFKRLESFLFSIKGMIVGFATYKLVNLASQAEMTAYSFGELQKSIHLTATTTLDAMREAIGGTVSDLDLMTAANQAVIYGAAHTTDQFRLLAEAAHRLGKIAGQETLEAMNNLSFGIAFMTERSMKHLGVEVNVTKAEQDYRNALHITTRELKENEKQQAFAAAAYEAMRRKLEQLGPETDLFHDALDGMTAAIANLAAKFAVALIPMFTRIADWIKELTTKHGPAIVAFGHLISETFNVLVDLTEKTWERLKTGQTTIGDIIVDELDVVWKLLKGPVLRVLWEMARFVGVAFWTAVGQQIKAGAAAAIDEIISFVLGRVSPALRETMDRALRVVTGKARRPEEEEGALSYFDLVEKNQGAVENLNRAFGELKMAARDAFNVGAAGFKQIAITGAGKGSALEAFDRLDKALAGFKGKIGVVEDATKKAGKTAADEIGKTGNAIDELGRSWDTFLEYVRKLEEEVKTAGFADIDRARAELEKMWKAIDFPAMNTDEYERALDEYLKAWRSINEKAAKDAQKKAEEAGKEIEKEISKVKLDREMIGADDLSKALAEIDLRFQEISRDLPTEEVEKLRKKIAELKGETALKMGEEKAFAAWKGFGSGLSDSIGGAIADGFKQGKKWSEVWADMTGRLFEKALTDAMAKLSEFVGTQLAEIMKSLGAGAGWEGLAGGLMGLAGVILGNLRGKGTSTVDEFTNQINSSEAVRGLVAGPTNVAISKVGEQLKTALRGTEALLERIARGVEAGWGRAAGGLPPNAVYPLSPSTAT